MSVEVGWDVLMCAEVCSMPVRWTDDACANPQCCHSVVTEK